MESLKTYLLQYGWTEADLDASNEYARIGLTGVPGLGKVACFESVKWLRRIFIGNTVTIRKIFTSEMKIIFSSDLKHTYPPKPTTLTYILNPIFGTLELLRKGIEIITRKKSTDLSIAELTIDQAYNTNPVTKFPFDSELKINDIDNMLGTYEDREGNKWVVDHSIFSSVTKIQIVL